MNHLVNCSMGEYVIDWGPGYHVYLAKDGETLIILFGGGTKRGQQKDIERAKSLHLEYKARKGVSWQALKRLLAKKAKSAANKTEKGKR